MTTTGIFVAGILIALALYDMVIVLRNGVGCSASRFMQRVGFKSPILVFVTGVLCGHFWLPLDTEVTDADVEKYIEAKAAAKSSEVTPKLKPYPDPISSGVQPETLE